MASVGIGKAFLFILLLVSNPEYTQWGEDQRKLPN